MSAHCEFSASSAVRPAGAAMVTPEKVLDEQPGGVAVPGAAHARASHHDPACTELNVESADHESSELGPNAEARQRGGALRWAETRLITIV